MKTFGMKKAIEGVDSVDAPVGEQCFNCEKTLTAEDCGFILPYHFVENDEHLVREVSYHRACLMKNLFGEDG